MLLLTNLLFIFSLFIFRFSEPVKADPARCCSDTISSPIETRGAFVPSKHVANTFCIYNGDGEPSDSDSGEDWSSLISSIGEIDFSSQVITGDSYNLKDNDNIWGCIMGDTYFTTDPGSDDSVDAWCCPGDTHLVKRGADSEVLCCPSGYDYIRDSAGHNAISYMARYHQATYLHELGHLINANDDCDKGAGSWEDIEDCRADLIEDNFEVISRESDGHSIEDDDKCYDPTGAQADVDGSLAYRAVVVHPFLEGTVECETDEPDDDPGSHESCRSGTAGYDDGDDNTKEDNDIRLKAEYSCKIIKDDDDREDCWKCECSDINAVWSEIGCVSATGSGIVTRIFQIAVGIMGAVIIFRIVQVVIILNNPNPSQDTIGEAREIIISIVVFAIFLGGGIIILRFLGYNVIEIGVPIFG